MAGNTRGTTHGAETTTATANRPRAAGETKNRATLDKAMIELRDLGIPALVMDEEYDWHDGGETRLLVAAPDTDTVVRGIMATTEQRVTRPGLSLPVEYVHVLPPHDLPNPGADTLGNVRKYDDVPRALKR